MFSLIIFVHEFGHFITAKLSGVRVNEFSIGMGPKIFGFERGETMYALRIFPIGGFCAMEGEDEDSDDPHAFNNAKVWRRILIVAAGAIMNMLLGLVMMLFLVGQEEVYSTTTISVFPENSALQEAGLQVDDTFHSIDGYRIFTARDLSFALAMSDPADVDIRVNRGGEILSFENVQLHTIDYNGSQVVELDFYVYPQERTLPVVLEKTVSESVSVVRMVWASLGGLITGQFGLNDMAGPVGAAQAITQAAAEGLKVSFMAAFNNILTMMIVITMNLGIVNLLPLPALDGGRLVFLLLEAIRRKPVPAKYEGWVHAAGFVFLMAFMVVITFNDIMRLITGGSFG
jgi:regulator of sigma E protease